MTPPFPDDVEVAIVAHDNLKSLPATLDSLAAAGCPDDRITVVDVASNDGTRGWLASHRPMVSVRTIAENAGPNPGRNVGITAATHPRVLVMDADVLVAPEAVRQLRDAIAANPTVKVASPIVVHADRPTLIQYAGGAIHFMCEAINPWLDRPLPERGCTPRLIGAAPGCALLIDRSAAIDVGLFDERYFMGKDDGDFLHRVRLAGHGLLEVPQAIVFHYSRPRGTWLFYYQIRNRWHFMLKNYQWRTLFFILPCLLVHESLQLAVLVVHGHGTTYLRAIKGLLAMLPDLRRDRALTKRIRAVGDGFLLQSDDFRIRDDISRNPLIRFGKSAYEGFLRGYWHLLRATVLR